MENQSKQTSCCASGSILTSYHSDNWLFYDKRPTTALTTLPVSEVIPALGEDAVTAAVAQPLEIHLDSNTKIDPDSIARITVPDLQILPHHQQQQIQLDAAGGTAAAAATGGAAVVAFDFDECTAHSLTSSSCHSERSVIHLNCVVCFEDDNAPPSNTTNTACNNVNKEEDDHHHECGFGKQHDGQNHQHQAATVADDDVESSKPRPPPPFLTIGEEQVQQIKDNLTRESYQTFDDLKEDDGVLEIVNRHNVTPMQSFHASLLQIPSISVVANSNEAATLSNKFISTCQIEIKNPTTRKNCNSTNLKFIKVNNTIE